MIEAILGSIALGELDEHFDALQKAISTRRSLVREQEALVNKYTMQPGDTVRVVHISPKYLVGKLARVVEANRTRFVIEPLGSGWGRFQGSKRLTIPMSSVEKVG